MSPWVQYADAIEILTDQVKASGRKRMLCPLRNCRMPLPKPEQTKHVWNELRSRGFAVNFKDFGVVLTWN